MSESAGGIPRAPQILAVWRQEAAADSGLLLIAERLVGCQAEVGLWSAGTMAGALAAPSVTDIAAACADMPVQQILGVLVHRAEFDLEFARLLPGVPAAPPLDRSPGQLLARMAQEWVLVVIAYWFAREAYTRGEVTPDQPVHVPAAAELDRYSRAYDRALGDLIAGRRRLRTADDPALLSVCPVELVTDTTQLAAMVGTE